MISQNNETITKSYCFTGEYLTWYLKYSKYLSTLNINLETKDWRLKHIRGFINYVMNKRILFKDLKISDVHYYIAICLKDLAPRTIENRSTCLRYFLNYLNTKSVISFSGTQVFPKIVSTKYTTVPSFYTDDEIKKMISLGNKTLCRRDYCILLIFALYGIRAKDLQNLKLNNIQWNNNKIVFVQSKDNDVNELLLLDELRYSLIDYLKNERGKCDTDLLFVKDGKELNDTYIYNIVSDLFDIAGINTNNKHHGPHSLRHSLASSIINQGYGLREVANLFEHNDINTTKVYTTTNMKDLKKISLEVPTWKN